MQWLTVTLAGNTLLFVQSVAERDLQENLNDQASTTGQIDFDKQTAAIIKQYKESENLEGTMKI